MSDEGPHTQRQALDDWQQSVEAKLERAFRTMIVGAAVFAVTFGVCIVLIVNAQNDTEAETQQRRATVADLIDLGCNTDNGQDLLLAGLVQASIDESAGNFGSQVAPGELNAFDVQVLHSIEKISATQPTHLTRKFERVLAKLRDLAPCDKLVAAFLAGEPIETDPNALTDGKSPAEEVGEGVANGLGSKSNNGSEEGSP